MGFDDLCSTIDFSSIFLTPAHPHAQSLFLFPIVFGINLNPDPIRPRGHRSWSACGENSTVFLDLSFFFLFFSSFLSFDHCNSLSFVREPSLWVFISMSSSPDHKLRRALRSDQTGNRARKERAFSHWHARVNSAVGPWHRKRHRRMIKSRMRKWHSPNLSMRFVSSSRLLRTWQGWSEFTAWTSTRNAGHKYSPGALSSELYSIIFEVDWEFWASWWSLNSWFCKDQTSGYLLLA